MMMDRMIRDLVLGMDGYIPLANQPRRGRPRRGDSSSRHSINIALTDDEYEMVGKVSAELGTSMSDTMRRCFLRQVESVRGRE